MNMLRWEAGDYRLEPGSTYSAWRSLINYINAAMSYVCVLAADLWGLGTEAS